MSQLGNYDYKDIKEVTLFASEFKHIISWAINKIFEKIGVKSELEYILLTSLLNPSSNSVCAAKIEGVGAWQCLDCDKSESTITCNVCWKSAKLKHKGHRILYATTVNGTCDCGDPNAMPIDAFCANHRGPMGSKSEIDEYTRRCINENLRLAIIDTSNVPLSALSALLFYMQDKGSPRLSDDLNIKATEASVKNFLTFIFSLSSSNNALTLLLAEGLLKPTKFKTTHECISFENEVKIIKVTSSTFFNHECTCPIAKFLIMYWVDGFSELLYKFINHYLVRKAIGILYIYLYEHILRNRNDDLVNLSVQFLFSENCGMIAQNPHILNKMFLCLPNIFNSFFKIPQNPKDELSVFISKNQFNKKLLFGEFYRISVNIKLDLLYLLRKENAHLLATNSVIYLTLIELMDIIHCRNPINYDTLLFYEQNMCNLELIDVENNVLKMFAIMVEIYDFNNTALTKKIFTEFSERILKPKNGFLEDNKYSFHLTLFRGLAIFLNRYCFYFAYKEKHNTIKTNTNLKSEGLLGALKKAMTEIPKYKNVCIEVTNGLLKFFGFILSIGENYFRLSYQDTLIPYYVFYFMSYQTHSPDFVLLKYMIALQENEKIFCFNNILLTAAVGGSNIPLEKNVFCPLKPEPTSKWLNEYNSNHVLLCKRILGLLLSILRSNTCLLWLLGSAFEDISSNKISDELLFNVMKDDREVVVELVKEIIVSETMIEQNLAMISKLKSKIFNHIKVFLGEVTIENIILEMTNKTLTSEKTAKFSLKDEYLKFVDTNYIFFPRSRSAAEKYISEFKKDKITFNNVYFFPVLKIEEKLSNSGFERIFFNEDNFDFILYFTSILLTNNDFVQLQSIFLGVLLDYLCVFFFLNDDHFRFFKENVIPKKIKSLFSLLENNILTDEVQRSYCLFIQEKISETEHLNYYSRKQLLEIIKKDQENNDKNKEKDDNNINNINTINGVNGCEEENINTTINVKPVKPKTKKQLIKDKLKSKFKKKNDDITGKLGIDNIIIEAPKENAEVCIYCLKQLNEGDPYVISGKIGNLAFDHFMANAFFQSIRKEFQGYYDTNLRLKEFKDIYIQPNERRNLRILTCNHPTHFSCFYKGFMSSSMANSNAVFHCPLCKKLANVFIPDLRTPSKNKETKAIFDEFDIEKIKQIGIEWEEFFKEKEKRERKQIEKECGKENKEDKETKENENKYDEKKYQEELTKSDIPDPEDDFSSLIKDKPSLVDACLAFAEAFAKTTLLIGSIDLLNKEKADNFIMPFMVYIYVEFKIALDFFENVDQKNEQIENWKNFILCTRALVRTNIMSKKYFAYHLHNLIIAFQTMVFEKDYEFMLQYDMYRIYLSRFLFLINLFCNYEQIKGYEVYILNMLLPYFVYGLYLKKVYTDNTFTFYMDKFEEQINIKNAIEFVKEDKKEFNRALLNLLKKIQISNLLLTDNIDCNDIKLDKDSLLTNLNLEYLKGLSNIEVLETLNNKVLKEEQTCKLSILFPIKYTYMEIFEKLTNRLKFAVQNKLLDNILNPGLLGSCLPYIFNFIELPQTATELFEKYYDIKCSNCQTSGRPSLICMDCGKKYCDDMECGVEFKGIPGLKCPAFIDHAKICGGGKNAYLATNDLCVLFISGLSLYNKFMPLYVNKYGEKVANLRKIGNEYTLNKEEVEKARKTFATYSYTNAKVNTLNIFY